MATIRLNRSENGSEAEGKQDFLDSFLNNKQMELLLRSAHIQTQVSQYMMASVLFSILPFFAMMMIGVLFYVFDINLGLIPGVPDIAVLLGGAVLLSLIVFLGMYFYGMRITSTNGTMKWIPNPPPPIMFRVNSALRYQAVPISANATNWTPA